MFFTRYALAIHRSNGRQTDTIFVKSTLSGELTFNPFDAWTYADRTEAIAAHAELAKKVPPLADAAIVIIRAEFDPVESALESRDPDYDDAGPRTGR